MYIFTKINRIRKYSIGKAGFCAIVILFTAIGFGRLDSNYDTKSALAAGNIYYVSSVGVDSNSGTESLPFRSIAKCASVVVAGDTCLVADGQYTESGLDTNPGISGDSNNPIIFKSINKHGAVITSYPGGSTVFSFNGTPSNYKSYITVDGFEVTGPVFGCINAKYMHHVTFVNNKTHDCGGGGLGTSQSDYTVIKNNISYRNGFISGYQESGISIYQARAVDNLPGFHNVIANNISFDNKNTVPDGGGNLTDGNGIIIDDFRNNQNNGSDSVRTIYTPATLVENNIVFNNGGRGIHVFFSNNITVRNNTVVGNNNIVSDANGGDLSNIASSGNNWYNNAGTTVPSSANGFSGTLINNTRFNVPDIEFENINNTFKNNLGNKSDNSSANLIGFDDASNQIILGDNSLGIDPLFEDPYNIMPNSNNFVPKSNSPLINTADSTNSPATDFFGNVRDSQPDIGAIEYSSPTNTSARLNIKVNLAGAYNSLASDMSNNLRLENVIPAVQPYSVSPFLYTGTEILPFTNLASDIVDWVLVEIVDSNNVIVIRKAAILKSDGSVIDSSNASIGNPTMGINLGKITSGNYKIILRHRNHIAIATNNPIILSAGNSAILDFTTNANVKATNQILLNGFTVFGLRQSDATSDGVIDALDRSFISSSNEFSIVYDKIDLNLDGSVDALDRSIAQNSPEAQQSLE
jgi:parallel beta-helix repeat protein